MKLFEYCNQLNLLKLSDDRRRFITKLIVREVQMYALKNNIDPEEAYFKFSHGLTKESQRELPDGNEEEFDNLLTDFSTDLPDFS